MAFVIVFSLGLFTLASLVDVHRRGGDSTLFKGVDEIRAVLGRIVWQFLFWNPTVSRLTRRILVTFDFFSTDESLPRRRTRSRLATVGVIVLLVPIVVVDAKILLSLTAHSVVSVYRVSLPLSQWLTSQHGVNMAPEILDAVKAISQLFGVIVLQIYPYNELRFDKTLFSEWLIRTIVRDYGFPHSGRVLHMLLNVKNDRERIRALQTIGHADTHAAEELYRTIQRKVNLEEMRPPAVTTRQRRVLWIAAGFLALADLVGIYKEFLGR